MVFVNDLMSYYKEFDDERDQTSLVNNYCQCEGISLDQALDKLTKDTIHDSEQIIEVFKDKDPKIVDTLRCFMQGYVTWHLCDHRYRLYEIYEKAGDSPIAQKFKDYCVKAHKAGRIDSSEWAYPKVIELVAADEKQAEHSVKTSEVQVTVSIVNEEPNGTVADMHTTNGLWPNGISTNGVHPGGIITDGVHLNSHQPNGVHVH